MENPWPLILCCAGVVLMTISFVLTQNAKEEDKIKVIKLQDSIRMMHKIDSIKYSHHE